jgi:subtilisin family serine protease
MAPSGENGNTRFNSLGLDTSVIAIPLLDALKAEDRNESDALEEAKGSVGAPASGDEILIAIELNAEFPGGLESAKAWVLEAFKELAQPGTSVTEILKSPSEISRYRERYLFARIPPATIRELYYRNLKGSGKQPIRYVWPSLPKIHAVIIDINLEHRGGRDAARRWVKEKLRELVNKVADGSKGPSKSKEDLSSQYVFAKLSRNLIRGLVAADSADPARKSRAIYHIWPDFLIKGQIVRSISTVKADAAHKSFSALGEGITWAVMDSGINQDHPHFQVHGNLKTVPRRFHRDFSDTGEKEQPFDDIDGHGTHVAGILAGEPTPRPKGKEYLAVSRFYKENGDTDYRSERIGAISGMAPKCKLVSLKVLDPEGNGLVSNLIAAIAHVQKINGYGRRLLIQGVNISLGYTFEPEWFACGQSPICVEVNRLVKSGVIVVVAAGNTGYGSVKSEALGATAAGLNITINDPGNAELALTVGSTHRDMPHIYGVSYFSSKGPTGDGRLKPDIVAPGEKIISCACGKLKYEGAGGRECDYVETSGTSMAAPHVSGVIAAFLSVRREFIGQPERVKEILLSSATDLKRERYFQGSGLVDLMRAIQSV